MAWIGVHLRPYEGAIHTEVYLPETLPGTPNGIHASAMVKYSRGDKGWEDALRRWIWLQGYIEVPDEEDGPHS